MILVALGMNLKTVMAEDGVDTGNNDVQQKLNQIISAQTEILKQLEEIKSELQIVKVRASLKA